MPEERRPVDAALKEVASKSEGEAVTWWVTRLDQVAAIPMTTARAGAMIPISRELEALPKAQRVAMLRARILAFGRLTAEHQERLNESRPVAFERAPEVTSGESKFIQDEVLPTLPADVAERVKQLLAQAQRKS